MAVMLELLGRGPARPDLWDELLLAEPQLAAMLHRWITNPPEVHDLGGAGLPKPDEVHAVLVSGGVVLFDVPQNVLGGTAGPADEAAMSQLADLLIVAAHAGTGFGVGLLPRIPSTDWVWPLLSGAVAALTGDDVIGALAAPTPHRIRRLPRAAREAIRDVITAIVIDGQALTEQEVAGMGRALGLAGPDEHP